MATFKGKPPGSGSGEMSRRTQDLRPSIGLPPRIITEARRMRRDGHEAAQIAIALNAPLDEVEKALVQMRSPRPESTRGTLNVTLAAHRLVMQERKGNEPIWMTLDRMMDELLRLRNETAARHDKAEPGKSSGVSSPRNPSPRRRPAAQDKWQLSLLSDGVS